MGLFRKKSNSNLEDPIIDDNSIEGDRDDVTVDNNKRLPIKNILVIAVMILVALIAVFSIFKAKLNAGGTEEVIYEVDQAHEEQYNRDLRDSNFDIGKRQAELEAKKRAEEEARKKAEEEARRLAELELASSSINTTSNTNNNTSGGLVLATPDQNPVLERMLGGSILLPDSNIYAPNDSSSSDNGQSENLPLTTGNRSGDFLTGSSFANGSVEIIKNRDFLLSSGTVLNCVLRTKVVTTYEGLVLCQLAKDIYSDNGKNLLVRSGAILEGQQNRTMMQGQARVFINWGTIRDGDKIIRIDALGTDMLGASGVPAWVDNHFWKRFGNALLLSFIQDAVNLAQTQANKSLDADSISIDNMGNTGSRMAEMALENSINIPPTAYINQGEIINVIVPRNVDFSNVYKNVSIRRK